MSDLVLTARATTPAPCGCCGTGPAVCGCALFIPLFAPSDPARAYASHAAAAAALAAFTASCVGYLDASPTPTSFTADKTTPNQIALAVSLNGVEAAPMWAAVTVAAGGTITIPWSGTASLSPSGVANAVLVDCATGATIAFDINFGTSGTLVLTGMPAGTYYLKVVFGGSHSVPQVITETFTATADVTMLLNPVVALWNDAGTVRRLEACPKLLLPILTEITATWYADCAAAAAAIIAAVENCLAFMDHPLSFYSSIAMSGGSTPNFSAAASIPPPAGGTPATVSGDISFSIDGPGTVSFPWAYTSDPFVFPSPGYGYMGFELFDGSGTLVDYYSSGIIGSATGSGTYTSISLPAGRYILFFISVGNDRSDGALGSSLSFSFSGSSSATLVTNPVEALYDVGLLCPARLDCGDTCP